MQRTTTPEPQGTICRARRVQQPLAKLSISNTMLGLAMLFVALLGVSSSGYREIVEAQAGEGLSSRSIAMALATVLFCLLPWGLAGLARGRGEKAQARYNGVFGFSATVLLVVFSVELFGSGLLSLKAAVTGTAIAQPDEAMVMESPGNPEPAPQVELMGMPSLGALGKIGSSMPSFDAERRMIDSMRRTSDRVAEPQKTWLHVTADWLDTLCDRHEAVGRASKGMRSFRDPVWINSADQIRTQHRIHKQSNAANDALIAWLVDAEKELLRSFAKRGKTDEATLRSVQQFLSDLHIDQRIKLAMADREACTTAEHMGELLEFAWGGWLYDTQRNTVVFDSSHAGDAWNALNQQLRGAERMRSSAEARLMNAAR